MWKSLANGCGFLIRACHLNRNILTTNGTRCSLAGFLRTLPDRGQREIAVRATSKCPARAARVTLHYGNIQIPLPDVLSPWLKNNRPAVPLRVGVVELVETQPPKEIEPVRWILFSSSPVHNRAHAEEAIRRYEQRPTVEDFHKGLKTGCSVEKRQLQTAKRLELVAALSSVIAVRLLQLKTAAQETPNRPAKELIPTRWIQLLQIVRNRPFDPDMTIYDFIRQLAGLGGFLLRKSDGESGWISTWRGFEKLQSMIRGIDAEKRRSQFEKRSRKCG
jgi:hypothetical protein